MPAKSITLWISSGHSCIRPSIASLQYCRPSGSVASGRFLRVCDVDSMRPEPALGAQLPMTSAKLPRPPRLCRVISRGRADARGRRESMLEAESHDLAVRVWFRFIRLESRLQLAVADRLREIGLSVPQCDVLTTLTEAEGVSQQDLAKRLYVTKGNISGLLDRLEDAGLVERRSIAADRRQYAIYLTAPGRASAQKAIAVQHALIAATLGKLPADSLARFEDLLIVTRDLMRAHHEQTRP